MRSLIIVALLSLSAFSALSQELPEYVHLPYYKIDLDLAPSERFAEVTTAMKD